MPIELSQLMQLAQGSRPHLQIGDLPRPVAEYLGCHPGIVFLGSKELKHIAEKHGEVRREELQSLFLAVKNGSYYINKKTKRMTVYWAGNSEEKLFKLGLKPASEGCEVWVQTFFRTNIKNITREMRKLLHIHGKKF